MLSFLAVSSAQPTSPVADGIGIATCFGYIDGDLRTRLVARLDELADMGARTIRLRMGPSGGQLNAIKDVVAAMDRLHDKRGVQFEAYVNGGISGTSIYIFLAAQRRYAQPDTGFMFHNGKPPANVLFGPESLREFYAEADARRETLRSLLKSRRQLPDAIIDAYLARMRPVTAEEAFRDGFVTAIRSYPAPASQAR